MTDLSAYREAVAAKRARFKPRGLTAVPPLHPALTPLQAHGVTFALRAGCSALFYDTGLGKTLAALDWARCVTAVTGKPVLMLCPLACAAQHQREADNFGIIAKAVRDSAEVIGNGIFITNYERLALFNPSMFGGVILDESSILKSFTGATTRALIGAFAQTPFRLACTATPAPNDHTELGTHAEFLGVMRREEMLTRWFVHDSADTGTWRLKGHAAADFWSWVSSWARCAEKPSDLGFSDAGYELPELRIIDHLVESDMSIDAGEEKSGQMRLIRMPEVSATSMHREKRLTLDIRMDVAAQVVAAEPNEMWITWVETDREEDAIRARFSDAIAVRGSMTAAVKEDRLTAFTRGEIRHLVTKPKIAGFGLNWQHCGRQAFPSETFSYEQFYQAIRRSWRFGRRLPVHVHRIGTVGEVAIREAQNRKAVGHQSMKVEMRVAMRRAVGIADPIEAYNPTRTARAPAWLAA